MYSYIHAETALEHTTACEGNVEEVAPVLHTSHILICARYVADCVRYPLHTPYVTERSLTSLDIPSIVTHIYRHGV